MPLHVPTRTPTTAVLLALGLGLGLAACSEDEPTATRSAAGTASPRPSASATPSAPEQATATTSSAAPAAGAAPERSSEARATASAAPSASPQDPLSPLPGRESAAPLGQPQCRPTDLTVVDADTLVLEQVVQQVYAVRTSGPACQLEGYPGVQLADATGARVPVAVVPGAHELTARPAPVTLSRTTSVSFVLATPRDGTCLDAATAEVTLPGTSTSLRTATSLSVCGGSVGVSPVQRRTDEE